MKIRQHCPRDMNDYLGSRNEINQKILLEEKNKKTIVSTSLGECNAGDRMTMPGHEAAPVRRAVLPVVAQRWYSAIG
ncbi:hypothetical protein SFRURICE_020699 [Spodoptera frugiperda]|uniref:SFRICE_028996 n=1 Tax=Spodoptera frugiperda TaxID=7108 RepID=A0A2H1WHI5_SPOFR|nr:hypothetical protein SFRURICE_020699 [Spodoptera frugiperda]